MNYLGVLFILSGVSALREYVWVFFLLLSEMPIGQIKEGLGLGSDIDYS